MAGRRTYTTAEKAEALKLYEDEGPSAVEKQLGIPKNTVAGWAKRTGVRTVRSPKTESATRAAAADAAAVRQAVASKSIEAADKAASAILDRLDAEGHDIPIRDLATVLGILTDKHIVIAKLATAEDNHGDARSVIGDLVKGLGEDYERRHQ